MLNTKDQYIQRSFFSALLKKVNHKGSKAQSGSCFAT